MKKLTLLLLILFSTLPTTQGQTQKGLGFGVRTGINLADYTGSRGDFRPGFTAGLYTDYYFAPRWALELGAYYSSQGSKNIITQGVTSGRVDNLLDYAQLQIGVKYNIVDGFRAFALAQGAYLIKANQRLNFENGESEITALNNIAKWDAGITAGVGYTFHFGLDLQASYTHGLINLFETGANVTSYYRVTVGWRFIGTGDKATRRK